MIILKSERLTLRELEVADAPFVLELLNTEGFIANIGDRGVRTQAEAQDYIVERVLGSYQTHGFGMWLVLQDSTGLSVGLAGLVKREGLDVPDVGYAFVPRAWGQGFAQEAAGAVLRHAQEVMGIPKLAAITSVGNHASMAVLRKIGFAYQGMTQLPGMDHESTLFYT